MSTPVTGLQCHSTRHLYDVCLQAQRHPHSCQATTQLQLYAHAQTCQACCNQLTVTCIWLQVQIWLSCGCQAPSRSQLQDQSFTADPWLLSENGVRPQLSLPCSHLVPATSIAHACRLRHIHVGAKPPHNRSYRGRSRCMLLCKPIC